MRTLFVAVVLIGLSSAVALANAPPPQGAKPLSELLQSIEEGANFGHIDEVDWDDGTCEVEYYTKAGVKKAVRIVPVSGNPRQ